MWLPQFGLDIIVFVICCHILETFMTGFNKGRLNLKTTCFCIKGSQEFFNKTFLLLKCDDLFKCFVFL